MRTRRWQSCGGYSCHVLACADGNDNKVFEVYQDFLEQVASDAFDAAACNEAGCVIVTKETLLRKSPRLRITAAA